MIDSIKQGISMTVLKHATKLIIICDPGAQNNHAFFFEIEIYA